MGSVDDGNPRPLCMLKKGGIMVIIEKVNINGEEFSVDKDGWDKIDVSPPTDKHPYWLIKFYAEGKCVESISATGNVYVVSTPLEQLTKEDI